MHFSGADPMQTSQPAAQATIPVVSKKNFGKAYKQSKRVLPKHKAQLATHAEIDAIAELDPVKVVVPTKYLPQVSLGLQSINEALAPHKHFSIS